jgi:hypothetical protein
MIREVSRCPYCGHVSAGVDDDRPGLVIAPDRADGRGCSHLAFVWASLDARCQTTERPVPGRAGHWLWVRGEGVRLLPEGPADPLAEYVEEVACGSLAAASLPTTAYRIGGGAAGERDAARPGSGEFPLAPRGGRPVAGILDGHGLYSPAPDALVAEVRRLAGPG